MKIIKLNNPLRTINLLLAIALVASVVITAPKAASKFSKGSVKLGTPYSLKR